MPCTHLWSLENPPKYSDKELQEKEIVINITWMFYVQCTYSISYHKVVPLYFTCTHIATLLCCSMDHKSTYKHLHTVYIHHISQGRLLVLHLAYTETYSIEESIEPAAVKSLAV